MPPNQVKLIFSERSCYPNMYVLLILDKYFKSYFDISEIWLLFDICSFQIWSYNVTEGKNLSFLYSKSYSPLNIRRSHQILWFCCIPNRSYREDNLRTGRIYPLPYRKANFIK